VRFLLQPSEHGLGCRSLGGRLVSVWQIAEGIAAPWRSARGWCPVRSYIRLIREIEEPTRRSNPFSANVLLVVDDASQRRVHELIEETLDGH
jgi:hypothetical protein